MKGRLFKPTPNFLITKASCESTRRPCAVTILDTCLGSCTWPLEHKFVKYLLLASSNEFSSLVRERKEHFPPPLHRPLLIDGWKWAKTHWRNELLPWRNCLSLSSLCKPLIRRHKPSHLTILQHVYYDPCQDLAILILMKPGNSVTWKHKLNPWITPMLELKGTSWDSNSKACFFSLNKAFRIL